MSFQGPQPNNEPNQQQPRQPPPRQQQQLPTGQQPFPQPQHIAQQQHQQQQQQPLQQQHPPQGQPVMNGVNGGGMPAGMPVPTPAGHQAELNYIYGMVEELSRQLAENRRVTEDIVSGLGRVRTRARTQGLGNEEIIGEAVEELSAQEQNLETLTSVLSESLEKAKHSRDANATLLTQYANALALMLKQFHEYKTKHVADVTAWHRSYREQLDEARKENSKLREQVWEMQSHAAKANENLREFRRRYDEDEKRWARRVNDVAHKQELRFWRRMAMPELEDDDLYWSDDNDLIDPAEKERLRDIEQRVLHEQMMIAQGQGDDSDEQGQNSHQQAAFQHMGVMGGIAMQREDTSQSLPAPPPRPLSAASSTGSTGS